MGQKAAKASQDRSYPSLAEVVEEIRRAKEEKKASMVRLMDLASALKKDRSHVRRTASKMGIQFTFLEGGEAAYISREDAARVIERMA